MDRERNRSSIPRELWYANLNTTIINSSTTAGCKLFKQVVCHCLPLFFFRDPCPNRPRIGEMVVTFVHVDRIFNIIIQGLHFHVWSFWHIIPTSLRVIGNQHIHVVWVFGDIPIAKARRFRLAGICQWFGAHGWCFAHELLEDFNWTYTPEI